MDPQIRQFSDSALEAINNRDLQTALAKLSYGFPARRLQAAARLPEFEALRDEARSIKDHVLEHLDIYLERYEAEVLAAGGQVHWCIDANAARAKITEICKAAGAKTVTKSKSMIGEEIAINGHLESEDITPVETDLGEYIIQLRDEPPSHIIAPAVHLTMDQIADTFVARHEGLDPERALDEPRKLLEEARAQLRDKFIGADVGLTGANMLIAETGSNVLVTNEGNADLTYSLPKVHIVIASLEKIVPTLEDAATILRVLARSATGQEMSVYTTLCTGPRREADVDGPDEYHVVLLDNGRSKLVGSEFQEMLRCIRCGACLNHCPVYQTVGGHAYGWVYSGPMGSVLVPGLIGLDEASNLPNASTLCGKCESVCPMRIPLPRMLRSWRQKLFETKRSGIFARVALRTWAALVRRPGLYRVAMGLGIAGLGAWGRRRGRFGWLPMAGGWTRGRDFPAPTGDTFISQWHRGARGDASGTWLRRQAP